MQGSAVYYRYLNHNFYILTKSDSAKAHNMLGHHQVALTIFDADEIKTLQLQGQAAIEAEPTLKQQLFVELVQPRQYKGEKLMPPITQLQNGGFIAFRITPTTVSYSDYKDSTRIIPSRYSKQS